MRGFAKIKPSKKFPNLQYQFMKNKRFFSGLAKAVHEHVFRLHLFRVQKTLFFLEHVEVYSAHCAQCRVLKQSNMQKDILNAIHSVC